MKNMKNVEIFNASIKNFMSQFRRASTQICNINKFKLMYFIQISVESLPIFQKFYFS